MRWRRAWFLITAAVLAFFVVRILESPSTPLHKKPLPPHNPPTWEQDKSDPPLDPLPYDITSSHPIRRLMQEAEDTFDALKKKQSRSLEEAVTNYKTRYGINPPPGFDKWYRFAKERSVQLIDEYDTIMESLLPFWALEPHVIRARVREALGYGQNGLIALMIRKGRAAKIDGGPDWQQRVTRDMIEDFVPDLPDMDIAFNVHDEPRVVVPHDELSRMVDIAKTQKHPAALAYPKPKNAFSPSSDLGDATRRIKEAKFSRFNEFPHQYTWVPSRLSCSPDSPARSFDENVTDSTHAHALGPLGFVYNYTAFTDICSSPSLRSTYGFFNRPNAFKIAHELIPIFSQSKISSFNDILYPSPWYHYGKTVTDKPPETHQVQYNSTMDPNWSAKETTFWWRGSTTGGFSRDGGWRRQHRQILMRNINALDTAKVLENVGVEQEQPIWQVKAVPRKTYKDMIDIHFSGVGQCDPGDCDAQREFFEMAMPVDPQEAWKYKFLLDIDGNAFSGRFYSFLKSKSLPLKLSIFREWHNEWLRPWIHFVPLSLRGTEHLEAIRYFAKEEEGKGLAERIARQGRQWSEQVLRNTDMEVWFYRLLLEYARVIDDEREGIGFVN